MNFKINIFGNNLEFSEEQMLGFKIQAFMNDLNEMLCVRIQNMFNTAGCLTNLSVNLEKNIKVIYQIMYEKTYEYIRGLNLLSNVEISDITMTKLDDTDRELWEEYKEFNHQMYQIKLEAEMDMRMQEYLMIKNSNYVQSMRENSMMKWKRDMNIGCIRILKA